MAPVVGVEEGDAGDGAGVRVFRVVADVDVGAEGAEATRFAEAHGGVAVPRWLHDERAWREACMGELEERRAAHDLRAPGEVADLVAGGVSAADELARERVGAGVAEDARGVLVARGRAVEERPIEVEDEGQHASITSREALA